jgi:hypothetical protein
MDNPPSETSMEASFGFCTDFWNIMAMRTASGTQISLYLNCKANTVWLIIADKGNGVPPEEFPKIVRPFYGLKLSDNKPGLKATLKLLKSNQKKSPQMSIGT